LNAIELIEKEMGVEYIIDSEVYMGTGFSYIPLALFYAGQARHPKFKNEYIGAYFTAIDSSASMMELTKEQIEELEFDFAKSLEGELIYSRTAEHCATSSDKSVYICGGRQHIYTNSSDLITFKIKEGKLVEAKPKGYLYEEYN